MHWTTVLKLVTVSVLPLAWSYDGSPCPSGCTLSIKSSDPGANDHLLSIKHDFAITHNTIDGRIGAYPKAQVMSPLHASSAWHAWEYEPTHTLDFSSYRSGCEILALQVREPGLHTIVNYWSPMAAKIIMLGQPAEWAVFTINNKTREVGVDDGTVLPSRRWVSWLETNGARYVGLWDGVTQQSRLMTNVTLLATALPEGTWASGMRRKRSSRISDCEFSDRYHLPPDEGR